MKKFILILSFLNIAFHFVQAQPNDPLIRKCIQGSGAEVKYLKDFTIQLGEQASTKEFRYKATLSLQKRTRYRFTMCTSPDSKGQLILNIRNNSDALVASSYDQKTGTANTSLDFSCQESGEYQIYYDFTDGQSGLGVSVVSRVEQ